jgi:hypothetical protein
MNNETKKITFYRTVNLDQLTDILNVVVKPKKKISKQYIVNISGLSIHGGVVVMFEDDRPAALAFLVKQHNDLTKHDDYYYRVIEYVNYKHKRKLKEFLNKQNIYSISHTKFKTRVTDSDYKLIVNTPLLLYNNVTIVENDGVLEFINFKGVNNLVSTVKKIETSVLFKLLSKTVISKKDDLYTVSLKKDVIYQQKCIDGELKIITPHVFCGERVITDEFLDEMEMNLTLNNIEVDKSVLEELIYDRRRK